MIHIAIEGDELVIRLEGLALLAAARRELRVPLAHITGAAPAPERSGGWLAGLLHSHHAGTHLPGMVKAGTFMADDGPVFYAAIHLERAVAVELRDERFRRLVVEPPDDETPDACAAQIRAAAEGAQPQADA
jgi:hypothetical protein